MKRFGVQVSTIEPGAFVQTAIFSDVWKEKIRQKFEALPTSKKNELGNNFAESEIRRVIGFTETISVAKYNKLSLVTEAMTHGLGAKHPKTRYAVGLDARPIVLLGKLAPDWLLDTTLRLILWFASK